MKLNTVVNEIDAVGVLDQTEYTIKANGHMMDILSGLYSDIPWAIVREYGTNMLDAYNFFSPKNGIIRAPEIHLPTRLEPWIEFKDFGKGMSIDTVRRVFTVYGETTKGDNNTDVGGLGLGAKTAFCYMTNDQWNIESRFNGQRHVFAALKNEQGIPTIMHLATVDTDEPNGVTIRIPVNPSDFRAFAVAAQRLRAHYPMALKIMGEQGEIEYTLPTPLREGTDWQIHWLVNPKDRYGARTTSILVMGNVPYPLDKQHFQKLKGYNFDNYSFHITAPVGSVNFVPAREALKYTPYTLKYLHQVEEVILDELTIKVQAELDACKTPWDALMLRDSMNDIKSFVDILDLKFNGNEDIMKQGYLRYQRFDYTSIDIMGGKARIVASHYPTMADTKMKGEITLSPSNAKNTRIVLVPDAYGSKEWLSAVRHVRRWMENEYIIPPSYHRDKRSSKVSHASVILIPQDGKDIPAAIKDFGGFQNIFNLSDIPEVTLPGQIRDPNAPRTKTQLKKFLNGIWVDEEDVDVDAGGFFVPIERNKPINTTLDNSGLNCLIFDAQALGLIQNDLVLYGIPRTHKNVETKDGWVNFLDYLKDEVTPHLPMAAGLIADSHLYDKVDYYEREFINHFKNLKDKVTDPHLVFLATLNDRITKAQQWTRVVSWVGLQAPTVQSSVNIKQNITVVRTKYPMLAVLFQHTSSSHRWSGNNMKVLLDYIADQG